MNPAHPKIIGTRRLKLKEGRKEGSFFLPAFLLGEEGGGGGVVGRFKPS
jgi:hypothetical protein